MRKDLAAESASLFISITKHNDLNRKSNPCKEDREYDFRQCVRNSLAKKIGCKLPWDRWSLEEFEVCSKVKEIRKYSKIYDLLFIDTVVNIVNRTGCPKPCHYKEYKLAGKEEGSAYKNILYLLANDEVMIEKEITSYSGLSLLADIGGSLGMFLGFSFLMVWDAAEAAILRIIHAWDVKTNLHHVT